MKEKEQEYLVKYPALSKIENFRDLGGYKLRDGRSVKHDMIFRSGAVANLDEAGKAAFDKLGIDEIFDFRNADEISETPDYVPTMCKYRNIPVISESVNSAVNKEQMMSLLQSDISDKMIDDGLKMFTSLYSTFPFGNIAYKEMFLAMDKGERILFHCSAGKDRTGVASALILLALGADLEVVKFDYLLSNYYRKAVNDQLFEKMKSLVSNPRVFELVNIGFSVNENLLQTSLDAISAKYNTIEEYFLKEFAIDNQRILNWKKHYTV